MEQKEIIEGNKLIAEFMGGIPCKIRVKSLGDIDGFKFEESDYTIEEMEHHKSWDWLMSVVGRIEKLGFDSRIMGNDSDSGFLCDFVDYENREAACVLCYQHDGGTKIECVFKAVTEFIRWYNSAPHKKTG